MLLQNDYSQDRVSFYTEIFSSFRSIKLCGHRWFFISQIKTIRQSGLLNRNRQSGGTLSVFVYLVLVRLHITIRKSHESHFSSGKQTELFLNMQYLRNLYYFLYRTIGRPEFSTFTIYWAHTFIYAHKKKQKNTCKLTTTQINLKFVCTATIANKQRFFHNV